MSKEKVHHRKKAEHGPWPIAGLLSGEKSISWLTKKMELVYLKRAANLFLILADLNP